MAVHVPVISKASTHEDFPKLGVPVWGPPNKDYSTLGYILGSSFRETTTFILEAQRKYQPWPLISILWGLLWEPFIALPTNAFAYA